MVPIRFPAADDKPLAGPCQHVWQKQKSPFQVAQVCGLCKLYRYKSSPTADWEYRAPILFAKSATE